MAQLFGADFLNSSSGRYQLNGLSATEGGNATTLLDLSPTAQAQVSTSMVFQSAGDTGGTLLTLQDAIRIDVLSDGQVSFRLLGNQAGESGSIVTSGLNVTDNGTHTVSVDYDAARGSMIAYVDGNAAGSLAISGALNPVGTVEIGGNDSNFYGAVDDILVTANEAAPSVVAPSAPAPVAAPVADEPVVAPVAEVPVTTSVAEQPVTTPVAEVPVAAAIVETAAVADSGTAIAEMPVGTPVVTANGILISSSGALNSALAQATGGETFLLQAGTSYQIDVNTWAAHSSPVTITSADHTNLANVTAIDIRGVDGLIIDHVRVQAPGSAPNDPDIRIVDSSNITISNSLMVGDARGFATARYAEDMLEAYNVDGLNILNNEVTNYFHGLNIHRSADVVVRGNDLHTLQGDGMRFSADKGVTIENNWFHDFLGSDGNLNHNDYIQFWTAGTNTPSTDIVIRGNLLANTSGTESQAIFMADEANHGTRFQNVLIEGNFIENNHVHGVTVNRADGVVIRDNSMPVLPGGQWGMLSKINVNDSTGAQIYDNLTNGVDPLRSSVVRNDHNGRPADLTAIIAGEETGANSFAFDGRFSVSKSGFVGNNAQFIWDFGDGTTASGTQVSKTYDNASDHQVVLTVLHNNGSSDTAALVASHNASTVQAPDDSGSLAFLHHDNLWA